MSRRVPTLLAIAALALAATARDSTAAPVIMAAGDIVCQGTSKSTSSCRHAETAALVDRNRVAAVLTLGDNQYESGSLDAFQRYYDPTWGRFKSITRPAVGNHEYGTSNAGGYFAYFGAAAGPPGLGYYSYDIGDWHLIALNSNCGEVSCGRGSAQERWLRADLAAHPASCTLAYWHHARFSSGGHGNYETVADLYSDLYDAGADVLLVGHDHLYERFAPQDPDADADSRYGIREFVVGTGGRSHYDVASIKPNSQVRNSDTFGLLELTLEPTSYRWRFVPVAGKTFTDSGETGCHGAPGVRLLRLSGPSRARLKGSSVRIYGKCASACSVSARVTVAIGRRRLKSRRAKHTLATARRSRMTLKFSKANARKLRRALARHRRLRATVVAVATDGAGNTSRARLRLRLRR